MMSAVGEPEGAGGEKYEIGVGTGERAGEAKWEDGECAIHVHDDVQGLNFCEQQLSSLPSNLARMDSLTSLDLSRNFLTLLQGELFSLTNLTWLNLDRNRLSSLEGILPPTCGKLVTLKLCFAVAGSKKRELPASLWEHYTLESLDVRFNCVRNIDPDIAKLTSLRSLLVGGNKLQKLPLAEIGGLSTLTELDISNNPRLSEEELKSLGAVCPLLHVTSDCAEQRGGGAEPEPELVQEHPPLAPGEHPPLFSQFFPLSTPTLRQRLVSQFGVELPHGSDSHHRLAVLQQLCKCWAEAGPRRQVHARGKEVPAELLTPLLAQLRATQWPRPRERAGVSSGEYLTLAKPVPAPHSATARAKLANAKTQRYAALFARLHALIAAVDAAYAESYTMIAVTKNFVGSPHMDQHDISYQWTTSLGEFEGGGELCIESAPGEVTVVDTKNRAAKVDGRFVHWVRGFKGERYSVVFFTTLGHTVPKTLALLPS